MVERCVVTAKHGSVTVGALGVIGQIHAFGSNAPLCREVPHTIESQRLVHTPSCRNVVDNGIFEVTPADSVFTIIGKLVARTTA